MTVRHIRAVGAAWLLALAAIWAGPVAAQEFPPLSGRVVDAANILPADMEARLTARLEALENETQRQFVVATIPDLQGYDIADYGYQLGRAWGIGDAERNDGALLIVAPNDRRVRIEVGYGLEPVLTDGLSFLIINDTILPRFKAGDMAGGVEAGAYAIAEQLGLPAEQAQQIAQTAQQTAREKRGSGGDFGLFEAFFMLVFITTFVLPLLFGRRGGRRFGGGPVIVWGGGSSGGGFGGGGGGFSGGGGSFGGGGASGSW